MSLRITNYQVGDVMILSASGRVSLGEGTTTLRNAVRQHVLAGVKKIILDLGDVSYVDSSGVGELVSAVTTAGNQGVRLKLLNLNKRIQDLLQMTKLYSAFEVHSSEAEAVRSFEDGYVYDNSHDWRYPWEK